MLLPFFEIERPLGDHVETVLASASGFVAAYRLVRQADGRYRILHRVLTADGDRRDDLRELDEVARGRFMDTVAPAFGTTTAAVRYFRTESLADAALARLPGSWAERAPGTESAPAPVPSAD